MIVDERRLAEIEEIANDRNVSGPLLLPPSWLRDACETIRAAWAERDESIELHGRCQITAQRRLEERDAAREALQLAIEHRRAAEAREEAVREQVKQLREKIKDIVCWLEASSDTSAALDDTKHDCLKMLEAIR